MRLDEASSHLCTFIIPYGRFRFFRVPYGLITATDEFQRVTDELFGDIQGTIPFIDDVIVWGETIEQQRERECRKFYRNVVMLDWSSM